MIYLIATFTVEGDKLKADSHVNDTVIKQMKIKYILLTAIGMLISAVLGYKLGTYRARKAVVLAATTAQQTDSVSVNGWASEQEYNYWKNATFTIPEYNGIPLPFQRAIVKILIDNKYFSTNEYFFTKIKDRARKVIAYGDFTGNKDKEMAFLLEKRDYSSSAIWIITEKGNIIYWKGIDGELPTIKRFSKGELIYMEKKELVPASSNGLILQTKSGKHVLIYNRQTKTFDSHYQYTAEDIRSARQDLEEQTSDSNDTSSSDSN